LLFPWVVAATAAGLVLPAAAVAHEIYVVDNWPSDIDNIPCSAWAKSNDGTWVLSGSIKVGSSVLENVGFRGDTEARLIERKCGRR
jgi:hypothetical protein